jgi:lipopolysaccharide export system permease protein
LKKLDKLLITSFVPPFIVTFFIALFVFVLQTLWLYIDDIAGKGVGFFILTELVGYLSVSMVPLSLPVAVLISSVMVLGNLAERYELSSMKSAGVSLWRTMRPLMVTTGCIGIFSYFCSNNFIPISNLKFKSRLYDIRQQKPALSLEESLFNQDFQGFSIRIGDKLPDNSTIRDVMVYDNNEASQSRLSMVAADSGRMFGSEDHKFFVMQLYNGQQISEAKPVTKNGKRNYPLMRSTFKSWTKVFDLDQFELDRTDESLFKSHHTMLSNRQLLVAIDSIDKEIKEKSVRMAENSNRQFYFLNKLMLEKNREKQKLEAEQKRAVMDSIRQARMDSLQKKGLPTEVVPKPDTSTKKPAATVPPLTKKALKPTKPAPDKAAEKPKAPAAAPPPKSQPVNKPEVLGYKQILDKPLSEYQSLVETFELNRRRELLDKAKSPIHVLQDQAASTLRSLEKTRESRVKHVFEFHSKFSLAFACVIFLFVGAPMGAIVRKGGFGWPLLISIVFFMLFIVISIFSKNIAERFVIDAVAAAWMNCLVVFPMGLALTYWAMRDMGWGQIVEQMNPKRWFKYWRKR